MICVILLYICFYFRSDILVLTEACSQIEHFSDKILDVLQSIVGSRTRRYVLLIHVSLNKGPLVGFSTE